MTKQKHEPIRSLAKNCRLWVTVRMNVVTRCPRQCCRIEEKRNISNIEWWIRCGSGSFSRISNDSMGKIIQIQFTTFNYSKLHKYYLGYFTESIELLIDSIQLRNVLTTLNASLKYSFWLQSDNTIFSTYIIFRIGRCSKIGRLPACAPNTTNKTNTHAVMRRTI